MSTAELDRLKRQTQTLPPDEKLELIKFLADSLATPEPLKEPQYLVFGKYRDTGRRMSTEEDFKLAEWHPTDAELDGD